MTQTNESPKNSNYTLLKVTGEDASSFLQGQLTADINKLNAKNWQYAGYCNPKGRLLALFIVWKIDDVFYLSLPSELVESISKRLRMYVMRSKVVIKQQNEIKFHLIIDDKTLQQVTGINDPSKTFSNDINCYHNDKQTILAFTDHYLLLSTEPMSFELETTELANETLWKKQHLLSGQPQVYAKSCELFIPQMLNLDKLNGISFDKGCYTGQEIIARMHYLGNVKQRMFVLESVAIIEGNESLAVADKIFADANGEKNIGQVVDFVNADGQLIVLAILRLDGLSNDSFYCANNKLKLNKSST